MNRKKLQMNDVIILEELFNGCINYDNQIAKNIYQRSEERRVGKECVP